MINLEQLQASHYSHLLVAHPEQESLLNSINREMAHLEHRHRLSVKFYSLLFYAFLNEDSTASHPVISG